MCWRALLWCNVACTVHCSRPIWRCRAHRVFSFVYRAASWILQHTIAFTVQKGLVDTPAAGSLS
jgi:hypothetical protein